MSLLGFFAALRTPGLNPAPTALKDACTLAYAVAGVDLRVLTVLSPLPGLCRVSVEWWVTPAIPTNQ